MKDESDPKRVDDVLRRMLNTPPAKPIAKEVPKFSRRGKPAPEPDKKKPA